MVDRGAAPVKIENIRVPANFILYSMIKTSVKLRQIDSTNWTSSYDKAVKAYHSHKVDYESGYNQIRVHLEH